MSSCRGRLDQELNSKLRLMGKVNHSRLEDPFGTGNSNYPAATALNQEHSTDVVGEFTQVATNKLVNVARVGYASYGINQASLTTWSHHWQAANGITNGGPNLTFRGFRSNRNANIPRYRNQNSYTIHDDFTYSYDAKGHHDLRAGGEYLHLLDNTRNCNQCGGVATVNGGPVRRISLAPADPFNADMEPGEPRTGRDRHALHRRCLRLVELPHADSHVEVRRVGAGRLEGVEQADGEPRRPLRPDLERVHAERHVPPIRGGEPSAGRQERAARFG
jgi:hypothetical protein